MTSVDLQGQVALITGASRGIGEAVFKELGQAGAVVIGSATSHRGAQIIQRTVESADLAGMGAVLDVRDAQAFKSLLEHVEQRFGGVTILVNNAGITRDNLAVRMKDEEWLEVIDVNLNAVFVLSRLVMRYMMKERRGRIVNITSMVGSSGNAGQSNYCAAKAGVAGMTRALAQELGSRNITVNCVAPGLVETDMTKNMPAQQKSAILKSIAVNRFGQPEDVAHVVSFLCSSMASYISGATVPVNGGMFMN